MIKKLEKMIDQKNHKAFFETKYELAKLRYLMTERSDTSNLAGANIALNIVRDAKQALG